MPVCSVPHLSEARFSDDFTGADNTTINYGGWVNFGAGRILSNSYTTTGTNAWSYAVLRDSGVSTGRMRIRATLGGSLGVSTTATHLVLCANAAGSQGLVSAQTSAAVTLGWWSGTTLGGAAVGSTNFTTLSTTPAAGDVFAFCLWDGTLWLERNGTNILSWSTSVHANIPATNQYCGPRVQRVSTTNSASWNDFRIEAPRPP